MFVIKFDRRVGGALNVYCTRGSFMDSLTLVSIEFFSVGHCGKLMAFSVWQASGLLEIDFFKMFLRSRIARALR